MTRGAVPPAPIAAMPAFPDEDVLVHIGLHKTATSWLQTHLFPNGAHGFFAPFREEEGTQKQKVKTIARLLLRDSAGRMIEEDEFDAQRLRERLSAIAVPGGLRPVVSSERLGGHPISGGFDRKILCRRIKDVFPRVRILIVIREQHAIILSNYMQYLRYGGWHSIEQFVEPPCDGRQPVLSTKFWCYDRLIALYQGTFGPDAVLVLPYELLIRAPEDFVARICAFAGVPFPGPLPWQRRENLRRGHFTSCYLRRMTATLRPSSANAYRPSLLGGRLGKTIDSGIKSAVQALVPGALEERVREGLLSRLEAAIGGDCFRESNRRTIERTGLRLEELGYRV